MAENKEVSPSGAWDGAVNSLRFAGRFGLQFLDGSFSLLGGQLLLEALGCLFEVSVARVLFGTA